MKTFWVFLKKKFKKKPFNPNRQSDQNQVAAGQYWSNDLKKSFDLNYKWLVDNQIKINNFDVMLEDITITSLSDFYEEVNSYLEYENIINSEMIYSFFEYETLIEKSHKEYYNRFNKTEQLYLIDGIEYNTNDLFKNELDSSNRP